jgi:hypothetical protein
MTPEQAKEASAAMFRDHASQMSAISARGVEQTREWSEVGAAVCDVIRAGEHEVAGLIEKRRREVAERRSGDSESVART